MSSPGTVSPYPYAGRRATPARSRRASPLPRSATAPWRQRPGPGDGLSHGRHRLAVADDEEPPARERGDGVDECRQVLDGMDAPRPPGDPRVLGDAELLADLVAPATRCPTVDGLAQGDDGDP